MSTRNRRSSIGSMDVGRPLTRAERAARRDALREGRQWESSSPDAAAAAARAAPAPAPQPGRRRRRLSSTHDSPPPARRSRSSSDSSNPRSPSAADNPLDDSDLFTPPRRGRAFRLPGVSETPEGAMPRALPPRPDTSHARIVAGRRDAEAAIAPRGVVQGRAAQADGAQRNGIVRGPAVRQPTAHVRAVARPNGQPAGGARRALIPVVAPPPQIVAAPRQFPAANQAAMRHAGVANAAVRLNVAFNVRVAAAAVQRGAQPRPPPARVPVRPAFPAVAARPAPIRGPLVNVRPPVVAPQNRRASIQNAVADLEARLARVDRQMAMSPRTIIKEANVGMAFMTCLDIEEAEFLQENDPDVQCQICLVEVDATIATARCAFCTKSIGCAECVEEWITHKKAQGPDSMSCPNCRAKWGGVKMDGPAPPPGRRQRFIIY